MDFPIKLLRKSGSALVWAMSAMMVLTLIAASLLTLAVTYYNNSLDEAMRQKAELLAQSGANYAVHMLDINSGDFSEDWVPLDINHIGKTADKKVYFDEANGEEYATLTFSIEESASNDEEKIESGEELRVYILRVKSQAFCGNSSASCSAVFWGYGEDGIWNFAGYTQL